MQTKEWLIFGHVTHKKSRKTFIAEYINDVRNI